MQLALRYLDGVLSVVVIDKDGTVRAVTDSEGKELQLVRRGNNYSVTYVQS